MRSHTRTSRHSPRSALYVTALAVVSILHTLSPTSAAAEKPAPIPELINALRSANFATRDEAFVQLLRQPVNRLTDIEDALRVTDDEETITRLTAVAQHLFLKQHTPLRGEVGLLGISLDPQIYRDADGNPQMCVLILDTQPGFPATEVLRSGDRLMAMNGERFPIELTLEDFRRTINATAPGTVIRFTVQRAGKTLPINVVVAAVENAGAIALSEAISARRNLAANYLARLQNGRQTAAKPLVFKVDKADLGEEESFFRKIDGQLEIERR